MKIQYCINIEGDESKLHALNRRFVDALGGNIFERKSSGYPLANSRLHYWKSKKFDSTLQRVSHDLISLLQSITDLSPCDKEINVTVVLVARCREESERPGLHLSAELIHLLGTLGASLDYDIVHDLNDLSS